MILTDQALASVIGGALSGGAGLGRLLSRNGRDFSTLQV
jgi:hypothetical protein